MADLLEKTDETYAVVNSQSQEQHKALLSLGIHDSLHLNWASTTSIHELDNIKWSPAAAAAAAASVADNPISKATNTHPSVIEINLAQDLQSVCSRTYEVQVLKPFEEEEREEIGFPLEALGPVVSASLEVITLANLTKIVGDLSLFESCPRLRSLDLSYCHLVSGLATGSTELTT